MTHSIPYTEFRTLPRSVSGVLRYLVDHDIQLPDRVRAGPSQGDVRWNRPNRATLSDMLRHPAYAGAYVYGRRHHDGRLRLPGKPHSGRRFLRDPQHWSVLHQGALPAYIDWATFERNQEQMAANRTRYSGTPRGGAALLGGLVTCGLCGRRMFTTYNENGREALCVPPDGDHFRGAALPIDQRALRRRRRRGHHA